MADKERPQIMVTRQSGFLRGMTPLDEELLREFPANVPLKIEVKRPRRSSPQIRLYWALLKVVCENVDQPMRPEALHEWLKLRLGYTHEIILRSGEIVTVPASIAFDQMDHNTFTGYMTGVKDLLISQIIPRVNSAKLEAAAREMLGEEMA